MTYLNCPRCGLTVRPRPASLVIEHCPRCIARRRTAVRLVASTQPADKPYAGDRLRDAPS
jgi:hypothetical protein